MIFTPFMMKMRSKIMVDRDIKEITADSYLKNLSRINGGPFTNLDWVSNHEKVDNFIEELRAAATRLNYYKALVVILSSQKQKKYQPHYNYYNQKMIETNAPIKEMADNGVASEKQKTNWMTMDEIMRKKNEILNKLTDKFSGNEISRWDLLLRYFIISLYTDIEPRRNEYLNMYVVKNESMANDNTKNYLVLDNHKMIFNNYKTMKKYGQQVFNFRDNENFRVALDLFLKYHPLKNEDKFRMLVKYDGSPITANGITTNLNSALKKGIGASMIRHIYLTEKYGDVKDQMERDADKMGHSVEQQKAYIKNI